jgi:hypothetical protein
MNATAASKGKQVALGRVAERHEQHAADAPLHAGVRLHMYLHGLTTSIETPPPALMPGRVLGLAPAAARAVCVYRLAVLEDDSLARQAGRASGVT